MTSGSHPTEPNLIYPENSLQYIVGNWWEQEDSGDIRRGRLIWAFIPHVRDEPWILELAGRASPTAHNLITYRLHTQSVFRPQGQPSLPTAVWHAFENEHLTVYPAKKRPALVISTGGDDVPRELRKATAKWTTAPTILVAPYYGAPQTGIRGGWPGKLIERIKEAEYPQFLWDLVPTAKTPGESILMLNRIQPIGDHRNSIQTLPYCLSGDALDVLDEWIMWLVSGLMEEKGILPDIQSALKQL